MSKDYSSLRLLRNAFILSSITSLPLWGLLYFFWPHSTDLIAAANALDMFSNQFWSGDLYPRWLEAADNHKGVPFFVFYAPLAFYVGSLWQFLSVVDPHGIARVLMTEQFFQIVSAVTCYYWLRERFDEEKAATASLVYAFFPYSIRMFYYGFSLALPACMMGLPVALLAVDLELNKQHVRAAVLCITAMCLLFLSHLLYTLVLIPAIIGYGIFQVRSNLASTVRLLCSGVIGSAMAAVYWLTAIINHRHFDMYHVALKEKFYDAEHFGYAILVPGAAYILFPIAVAAFFSVYTRNHFIRTRETAVWAGVLAFSWFIGTKLSQPLWENISLLSYFQYPYRFLILSIPAVVFLSAQLLSPKQLQYVFLYFVAQAVLISASATKAMYTLSSDGILPLLSEHRIVGVGHTMVGAEYATDLAYGHFDGGALPGSVSFIALVCAGRWVLFLKRKYKKQYG